MLIQAAAGAIASRQSALNRGVETRVLDSIQGHAPRNVSEGYGDVTIKAKANAIAKFPGMDIT